MKGLNLYPSSLQGINELIPGYFPQLLTGWFGPSEAGKSILNLQEAIWVAKQRGGNVLYIDTEGATPVFLRMWEGILKERFDASKVKVEYMDVRTIEDLLKYLGFKVELEVTDKGKVELRYKGESEKKPIVEDVQKKNIKVLVLDSMSNPLKISFPGGRQNLPARGDAINLILNSLHYISIDNELVSLVVHHQSMDPTNPYQKPKPFGGETIRYNFKVWLYLEPRTFRPHRTVRDVYLGRWFNKEPWSQKCSIYLDDHGFRDITQEELNQLARGAKDESSQGSSQS
jgi:archaellum biogenesis ATPase FlaH